MGCLLICWETHITYLCAVLAPRWSRAVRGDFLVETTRDDDNICHSLDPNWKNASMVYAHVFRDGNGRVVTLSLEEAVTETETKFFSISTETYLHTAKFWRKQSNLKSPSSEHCNQKNKLKTCTRKDARRHTRWWTFRKPVITRHKKAWYIKIVG